MKLSTLVSAGVVLGLPCVFAMPAEARDAGALGGGGGGEYRSPCPPNMGWYAYIGRAGSALDGIRALCTSLQQDKTTSGNFETEYHGGAGGERIQRTCPANSVVTAMRVWMATDRLVSKIDLTCTNLQDGAMSIQQGRTGGRPLEPSVLFSCDPGEVGAGIYGRSGAMIDSIGLICEKPPVLNKPVEKKQEKNSPETLAFCNAYADRMVGYANEFIALKCDTQSLGPGLKTTDRGEYYRNCIDIGPKQTIYNENPVKEVLAKCKAGPAGRPVQVASDTDLYDHPEPQNPKDPPKTLHQPPFFYTAGSTVILIEQRKDDWCHVSGQGHDGWVSCGTLAL